jgi:serine/threonine protein kinase
MARVFLVVDDEAVRFALKVLKVPHEAIRERLMTEGRAQAKVKHPNVVGLEAIVDTGVGPGLVLEFVDGPTLEDVILEDDLTLDGRDELAAGILAGVKAAHDAGLIHRDLKPANILVATVDGRPVPKITDFGLARVLGDSALGPRSTRTGMTMGTPAYMAPEQIRSARDVDQRADVYALGAVFYELYSGTRAYDDDDLLVVLNAVAGGTRTPLSAVGGLPPRVIDAVDGAMAIDVDARIPDLDTLRAVWSGHRRWAEPPASPLLRWSVYAVLAGTLIGAPAVFAVTFSLLLYVLSPGEEVIEPSHAPPIEDIWTGRVLHARPQRDANEAGDPVPEPVPAAVAPVVTPPSPADTDPAPQAQARFHIRVSGATNVRILGTGGPFENGDAVPPGTYQVHFQVKEQTAERSVVVDGADVAVVCDAFGDCAVK